MQSSLLSGIEKMPKDIQNKLFLCVLKVADEDPSSMRALKCVSRQWHAFFISRHVNQSGSVKQQLCHVIRKAMATEQARRSVMQPVLSMFGIGDNKFNEMEALLKLTANHFKTFTKANLPKNSKLKLDELVKLSATELYILHLIETGIAHRKTPFEELLKTLERILADNNPAMCKKINGALQELIKQSKGEEKAMYLAASSYFSGINAAKKLAI